MTASQKVVVLGASNKPQRYSNKCVRLLLAKGHLVIPVHPKLEQIEGLKVVHQLADIQTHVDTLTLYVGPAISSKQLDAIINLKPGRVIFNPGSENPELESALTTHQIPFERACTLVLLNTGQF